MVNLRRKYQRKLQNFFLPANLELHLYHKRDVLGSLVLGVFFWGGVGQKSKEVD